MKWTDFKNIICYGGLTKEEYEIVKPVNDTNNRQFLTRTSFAVSCVLLGLSLVALIVPALSKNRMLYFDFFVLIFIVYVLCRFVLVKHAELTSLSCYLFLGTVYLFAIILGVPLQPDSTAVTFCVLLFALPIMFPDVPWRMNLFLLGVISVFCFWSVLYKPITISSIDVTNAISFYLLSLVVDYVILKAHFHNILQERMANNAYHKQMESSLRANSETLAMVKMNLTTGYCQEVTSVSQGFLSLNENTTVEEFFTRALTLIPEAECMDYRMTFNRDALLRAYANRRYTVSLEHHMTPQVVERLGIMEGAYAMWLRTTVDLIYNPLTDDVEAVLYVHNIHDSKVSEAVISEVAVNDYEILALVYLKTDYFIYYNHTHIRQAKNDSDFYDRLTKNILHDQPEDEAKVLASVTHDAIAKGIAQGDSYVVMYTGTAKGQRRRKRIKFVTYNTDEEIMFVNKRDVTDVFKQEEKNKARLSAALDAANQANRAKSAFLNRISHDMRTPLNGILGLTNIMKDKPESMPLTDDLEQLERSGRFLLDLVNDTLDVAQIEGGSFTLQPRVCNGKKSLADTLALLRPQLEAKNITLTTKIDKLPYTMVYIDEARFKQVIVNILSNAIKFTPEGGEVTFSMENLEEDEHSLYDRITISDTGIGIQPEFLPHLFEPFTQEDTQRTSKYEGTGLGLSICRDIVKMMGGDISVESTPGKGTTFSYTLHIDKATPEQVAANSIAEQTEPDLEKLKGRRVLLCEDHPLNAKIAIRLLEKEGMIVEHAENGVKGVQCIKDSEPGTFDIILMDIRMPEMDGLDATRAIRNMNRPDTTTIPIIAMTANAFDIDREMSQSVGMNDHLAKPYKPMDLFRMMLAHLPDS